MIEAVIQGDQGNLKHASYDVGYVGQYLAAKCWSWSWIPLWEFVGHDPEDWGDWVQGGAGWFQQVRDGAHGT